MDLQNYEFPEVDFLSLDAHIPNELLNEAKERGFNDENNKYAQLFSELFFYGGKLVIKENVDEHYKKRVLNYLKPLMGSFSVSQEDKQAVCGMLLAEVAEPYLEK